MMNTKQCFLAGLLLVSCLLPMAPQTFAYGDDTQQRLYEQQREIEHLERKAYEARERQQAEAYQQREYQARRDEQARWQRQEDQRRQSSGNPYEFRGNFGRYP